MPLSDDDKRVIGRINANAQLLFDGYHETVDYSLPMTYHRTGCGSAGRYQGSPCQCPVVQERRTRKIKRKGLLLQLQDYAQNKDTDRNPKAERGAPRVKVAGRPPGDMAGFFAFDELICSISHTIERVLEEVGRDRTWACSPVHEVLRGLASQVGYFIESRPDQAREIDVACAGWVATARSTLKITTGDAIFDKIVCGNCGGGLGTPWGNRGESDVRCVGTPAEGPCGETYPMSEWVKLYEDQQRNSQ